MANKEINKFREKIDGIDNKLLELLAERSKIVNSIGAYKDKSKSVVDATREKKILERLLRNYQGHYSKDSLVRIWRELFYASSKLQLNKDSNIISKRNIDDIKIYTGGKTSIKGKKSIIKLSSNENVFGPSPKVLQTLNSENIFFRYPEINGKSLRENLSKIHLINPEQIILGNGSDEILFLSALAFCNVGDEIIHARHGFEMYPIISKMIGAVSVIAEEINYKISVDSILKKINASTKIIFIANPNNPTGTYLNRKELINLFSLVPKNIIIVIDGAYAEYVQKQDYDNTFKALTKFNNIIITRTFSKAYGLAGLRLGWCYTSKEIALILNKIKPPFNANFLALKAANQALHDQEHLNKVINLNNQNKKWFENELENLKINFFPSVGNFSFINFNKKPKIAEKINKILLENGIIIRQLISYNLPDCLRVTIGKKNEMEKIINVIKKNKDIIK